MMVMSDLRIAGGLQEHVLRLTAALQERNHQVTLFGPTFSKASDKQYIQTPYLPCCEFHTWASPSADVLSWSTALPKSEKLFTTKLTSKHFDVIHLHEPFVPFVPWQIIQLAQLPIVTSFHTAWDNTSPFTFLHPLMPLFRAQFNEKVKGCVFVSELTQACWKPLCHPDTLTVTVPNGVSSEFVPKATKKHTVPELVFLARLVSRKGGTDLITAAHKLVEAGHIFHLTIAGSGPDKLNLENLVTKYHLEKVINFVGEIRGKAKIALLQSADIFCAPYRNEAFGMTVLEAMACGCPIVGYRGQGLDSILVDYPAPQLLIKNGNPTQLAKALGLLLTDKKLRLDLRQWGIKRSSQFSWANHAQAVEKLYETVI
jgi:phosphatidylinositol alpha-mannosyltransferase